MTVGQKIKQIRLFKFGWSQDALAIALGMRNAKSIRDWEHDISYPHLKTFIKLLEVFDVTYDELMKGVEID